MMKMYASAATLSATLLLGGAVTAAQAAGPGAPSNPSADSLVTKVQGIGGGAQREGGGAAPGGGGPSVGGGRSGGGGGGSINRGGGGERGFVNRGGGDRGGVQRGGGGDRWVGERRGREGRGDHRGRHRYSRDRGLRIYLGPGYGYYDGDYDYSCEWLRRRAIATGSRYWWRRFRDCVY